jgi:hypothetical protein
MIYLVTDDQTMKQLGILKPPPAAERPIDFRVFIESMPIIGSPYLVRSAYERPRILKDFDRWFDAKLLEIGWRREDAKARRFEQSRDSSML